MATFTRKLMIAWWLTAMPVTLMAVEVAGRVVTPDDQPIAGAMITVRSASAAATVTKVFSGKDGHFLVPNLGDNVYVNSIKASVDKLGFEQTSPTQSSLAALQIPVVDNRVTVNFVMQPTTNVAAQVPASAWVLKMGDHPLQNDIINVCSQCHQFPNDRVKTFSSALASLDVSQREAAWRGMFAAMRVQMYGALQAENSIPATPEQIAYIIDAKNSFIDQLDEDLLAPWLAENFATSFDNYPLADVNAWLGKSGVNEHTVIRQFSYGEKSFVRETAIVDGNVWVVDISRNRLGKLDPITGGYVWHDVPSPGAPAPHSMVPDAHGNLWVTLLEANGKSVVRFDPKTGDWRIYDGFPKGTVAHDQSPGTGYVIDFDKAGYSWLTLITSNKVIGFHPETGEVTPAYDLPLPADESPFHVGVYGGALTADGHYWFAQNNGGLGRFNTETRKVDHYVEFERSTGPHRMVVHPDGTLYVSLIGSGQILAYDPVNLKEIKRIDLPDRASSPYSLIWDPVRNALWSGTVNSDRIFKYDIASDSITEYPTGIKDLHVRIGAVDPETGDIWIANSPIPSTDKAVRWVFSLHPGDLGR